jgi:hypothetical protein
MTITLVLNLSIFVSAEGTEKKVSLVPLDYLDNETSIVIATPINLGWIVSVSAKDINSAWDNDDEFGVVNFKNAIMEYNESNELEFIFNNSDYKNGSLAVLLFENKTKDEYEALQINFSETEDALTFQSKFQKERIINNSRRNVKYVLLEEKTEVVNDAKAQYNKTNPPPANIILAKDRGARYNEKNRSLNYYSTTTASTTFNVKSSENSNTVIGNYTNPFAAIQYIAQNRLSGYVVTQSNDGRLVFKYNLNDIDKFYLFQFGNYYGVGGVDDVLDWMGYADYAHAVRGDGIFGSNESTDRTSFQPYAHSYDSLINNPEEWALEGNTGAYVYKKSLFNVGYKSMSSYVKLKQASLKFDSNSTISTPMNAYVYMSSNSNYNGQTISCDFGLISSSDDPGNWYLIANRKNKYSDTVSVAEMNKFYRDDPIVTSTLNSNGSYTPQGNIYIYYNYGNGTVYCQIQNEDTGKVQEGYVNDTKFNTAAQSICLMTGTSLVPNIKDSTDVMVVSDIRNGGYLLNVIWEQNYIYKQNLWQGTRYNFSGTNSSATNYLLTYDTDNASCTTNSSRDVVNINYNSTYE